MRRVIYFLMLFLPALSFALDLDVEARASWLIPKSRTMRDVYGKGIPEYQIELGLPLNPCVTLFSDLSYYQASGHSSLNHKSTVENWGLTFGAKYYLDPWELFRPYFGLGIGASSIKFCDTSEFVNHHVDRFGFAWVAKLGTEVCFSRYFYLDLFAEYGAYNYNFKNKNGIGGHRLNAGGLKAGLGLSFRY